MSYLQGVYYYNLKDSPRKVANDLYELEMGLGAKDCIDFGEARNGELIDTLDYATDVGDTEVDVLNDEYLPMFNLAINPSLEYYQKLNASHGLTHYADIGNIFKLKRFKGIYSYDGVNEPVKIAGSLKELYDSLKSHDITVFDNYLGSSNLEAMDEIEFYLKRHDIEGVREMLKDYSVYVEPNLYDLLEYNLTCFTGKDIYTNLKSMFGEDCVNICIDN